MWCPQCKSEFRAGFDRCASCDVELIDHEPEEAAPAEPPPKRAARMEFCGFLSLEEAVDARVRLREVGLVGDILIRDAPRLDGAPDPGDEFWLLIDPAHAKAVQTVLDMKGMEPETEPEAPTHCPACNAKRDPRDRLCLRCGHFLGESEA